MRLLFLMAFQYTHILFRKPCRVSVRRRTGTRAVWYTHARRWLLWGGMASCGRLAIGPWLAAAVQMTGRRVANPPQDAILPRIAASRKPTAVGAGSFSGGSGRPILTIVRRFCQPAPHSFSNLLAVVRIAAAREDWNAIAEECRDSGRRIANPPQVANLPHIASAICLRWYRIVPAREDWNK
jgi:hypothetical protein